MRGTTAGHPRRINAACLATSITRALVDIGAYEFRLFANMVVNTSADTITSGDNKLSLREAIGLANGTLSCSSQLSTLEQAQVSHRRRLITSIRSRSTRSLNGSTLTLSTVGDSQRRPVGVPGQQPGRHRRPRRQQRHHPVRRGGDVHAAASTVTSTGNLTLRNLTLGGGSARGFAGGNSGRAGGGRGLGGAIFNQGSLTILTAR